MAEHLTEQQAQDRLWDELEKIHVGMLGAVGGTPHHFQPMTPFCDKEAHAIWFFTRDDNHLITEAKDGKAMFVVQGNMFQACIAGTLTPDHDRARIDKYWNAVVAAWYPEGKDDPHLTLLRFQCDDAQLWVSQAGPVRFFLEIAKANLTHKQPDVGGTSRVTL